MPLDRTLPLYQQITETLAARIAAGEWPPGAALPSEAALARDLDVSQGTLRKALGQLAAEGLVTRRQGRGTFIPDQPDPTRARPTPLVDMTGAPLDAELRSQVLITTLPPAHVARCLDIAPGTPAWCVERLSCLANRPAILERIYIAKNMLPELDGDDSRDDLPGIWRRHTGRIVTTSDDHLRPLAAPDNIAWALSVEPGAPIVAITQSTRDASGTTVEMRDIYVAQGPWAYQARHRLRGSW